MIAIVMAAIGGLIYGSFLNALLWRLPRGKGMGGRSQCRSCDHNLAWHDLVPVFSFLILRGRCRYCRQPIHIQYPAIECVVALLLAVFFYVHLPSLSWETGVAVAGLLILASLFFFDLLYFILPDVIVFPAIGFYLGYDLLRMPAPHIYLVTSLLAGAFFAILYAATAGRQLGFGDVKLAGLLGLMMGYPLGFISIVLGVWMGALTAIILLALKKVSRKDPIPFGSFLALAAIICIIFSHEMLSLLSLFQ